MGKLSANVRKDVDTAPAEANEARNNTEQYRPISNTSNAAGARFRRTRGIQLRLGMGVVLDTIPINHTYRVSTSLLATPIVCQALFEATSGYPMAATCAGYPVGADVIVAYDPSTNIGIIVGGYTPLTGLEHYAFRTLLSGVVRRYAKDEYTQYGITINSSKKWPNGSYHAANFAFNEHSDVPEWGMSYTTGTKVFTDPYMILMGTDDYTHLAIFNRDSLLRLSAINYQLRTFGREEECLTDEDEYIEYKGTSIMPYEQFGYMRKQDHDVIRIVDRDEWYVPDSTTSPYEPYVKDLKPFHRIMEFGGWLGQGKLIQVIPPTDDYDFLTFGQFVPPRSALSRMQMDVTGRIAMGTTYGVSITKYGCMPTAERINRPDEIKKDYNDNENTYYHHKLSLPKEIKKTAESPSMQEVLGIMDYSGYHKNWGEVFQLAYHTYDYQLDEETALNKQSINAPDYTKLQGSYLLPEDKTYYVDIDDSRTYANYTQNEAGIHILPSGGIVIYDGSGSEIRFVKGQITISCAGDINIKPGRNLNLWAGNDLIAKSKNAMELSSSKSSVRVKAEQNLELLGANNKQANCGVIIESKSTGVLYDFNKLGDEISTNGIVLKAPDSPVAILGDVAYVRSGVGDKAGQGVYLDSGKGKTSVYAICRDFVEYVAGVSTINFMQKEPSDTVKTTRFDRNTSFVVGQVGIEKDILTNGNIIAAQNIQSCNIISSWGNSNGMLSIFNNEAKEKMLTGLEDIANMTNSKLPTNYIEDYTVNVSPLLYDEQKIGNEVTLSGISFSFRTDEQLDLPQDYYVYEDLWQHISENSGGSPAKWEEACVVSYAGTTYPFPGKNAYEGSKYVTQDTVIADFKNGVYIDRNVQKSAVSPGESRYEDPQYGQQHKKSLNEYSVTK